MMMEEKKKKSLYKYFLPTQKNLEYRVQNFYCLKTPINIVEALKSSCMLWPKKNVSKASALMWKQCDHAASITSFSLVLIK